MCVEGWFRQSFAAYTGTRIMRTPARELCLSQGVRCCQQLGCYLFLCCPVYPIQLEFQSYFDCSKVL